MDRRELNVHLLPSLAEPDALAGRTVVVIDVLRATTTICHALAAGAAGVRPCVEIDEARAEAARLCAADVPGSAVLGGERCGLPIEGFDLGNSPTEYVPQSVGGRTVVFTTTNGTRALLRARRAEVVLIGAFVNLSATVRELRGRLRSDLLCAGTNGVVTLEDALLAGAIVEALTAGPAEFADMPTDAPSSPSSPLAHPRSDVVLNDQARLARDAWRTATVAGRSLSATLRECQGGRNLIAEGFDADIDTAAVVDRFDFVPRWDARSGVVVR